MSILIILHYKSRVAFTLFSIGYHTHFHFFPLSSLATVLLKYTNNLTFLKFLNYFPFFILYIIMMYCIFTWQWLILVFSELLHLFRQNDVEFVYRPCQYWCIPNSNHESRFPKKCRGRQLCEVFKFPIRDSDQPCSSYGVGILPAHLQPPPLS